MTTTPQSIFTLHSLGYLCGVPVNCFGVAGKGLAKDWREAFPAAFLAYHSLCFDGVLKPGAAVVLPSHNWILCATKDHWRQPSRKEWVEQCLHSIARTSADLPIQQRIALPALGCGCGGLDKKWFMEACLSILSNRPNITICIQ